MNKKTPEQENFYKYGKAVERVLILRDAVEYYRGVGNRCDAGLAKAILWVRIHEAKKLRAVCRRTCGKCVHFSPDEWGKRDGCLKKYLVVKSSRSAAGCPFFEPGREGKDDE